MGTTLAILLILLAVAIVVLYAVKAVKVVPEARVRVIERLGRFDRLMQPGLRIMVPFVEQTRAVLDLRVQSIGIPTQSVITKDDLLVNIDSIVYLQITDPRDAVYRVKDYERAVQRLVTTNLRNFVGELEFDDVLSSRDDINRRLRGVLDEATGAWGLRISRVELKDVLPSPDVQEMLQKQARAERDRRAKILTAEGDSDSYAIRSEGKAAGIKRVAEAEAKAAMTRAEGEAEANRTVAKGKADAITTVFEAIHEGHPDQQLLAYSYLQTLPELAHGDANKLWIVPSELGHALEGIGSYFGTHEADSAQPAPVPGGNGSSQDSGKGKSDLVTQPPVPVDSVVGPVPRQRQ